MGVDSKCVLLLSVLRAPRFRETPGTARPWHRTVSTTTMKNKRRTRALVAAATKHARRGHRRGHT
eukprot:3059087-Prymnesium_polylepis.1